MKVVLAYIIIAAFAFAASNPIQDLSKPSSQDDIVLNEVSEDTQRDKRSNIAASSYGAAPAYGASAPSYGASAPSYGASAPSYGASASSGYGSAPAYGVAPPCGAAFPFAIAPAAPYQINLGPSHASYAIAPHASPAISAYSPPHYRSDEPDEEMNFSDMESGTDHMPMSRSYSYDAVPAASHSGYGASVISPAAASGPAVGYFPNANVGGCNLPLLLSCSPSVVTGRLLRTQPQYAAPAHYGPAPAIAAAPAIIAPAPAAPAAINVGIGYRSDDGLLMKEAHEESHHDELSPSVRDQHQMSMNSEANHQNIHHHHHKH